MSNSDIVLFDKEEGITSFSSLYSIKRCYAKGTKVGHAGTLDKFASGLMIVLIGNATRLNPVFSSFDKSYIATIRFGEESDTLDPEGRIIKTSDLPSLEEVLYALDKIKGKSLQQPPVYSAVHVDGKRAYKEARKDKEIEMPFRPIEVYEARFISYEDGLLTAFFHVSKGTYIRSLARDMAYSINKVSRLEKLRRVSIGPYSISDIGKFDMKELLERTDLFSHVSLSVKYKKEIDNGFIRPDAVLFDDGAERRFKFLSFEKKLYALAELVDGRMKIIARV